MFDLKQQLFNAVWFCILAAKWKATPAPQFHSDFSRNFFFSSPSQNGDNQVLRIPTHYPCMLRCMLRHTFLRAYQVWIISTALLLLLLLLQCMCVTVTFGYLQRGDLLLWRCSLKCCPWENQDENITQMSGGFMYYEGSRGHRWMDSVLDYLLNAHVTAHSHTMQQHGALQPGAVM